MNRATPHDADDWIEALAGRPRHNGRRAAAAAGAVDGAAPDAEAALLRAAMRRWPMAAPPERPAHEAATARAVWLAAVRRDPRFAARRGCAACAGLRHWLDRSRPARLPTGWSSPERARPWWAAGLASGVASGLVAALAVIGLAPWWQHPMPPAEPAAVLRSGGVQRLRAADAPAVRAALVNDLAQAGITATTYERLGRFGLDAELPLPFTPAVREIVGHRGLLLPADGALTVEIETPP